MLIKVDFKERVESGSVQFEYSDGRVDWQGLFIRGDKAIYLQLQITELLSILTPSQKENRFWQIRTLEGLLEDIKEVLS